MKNPTCPECGKSVLEMSQQMLRDALAEVQAEAEREAIEDEINYQMARPRLSPELDLYDLQNGLGW